MSEPRKCWPAEWADEVMPPGRLDPNDYLIDVGQGRYFLGYPLDATDVTEFDKRFFNQGVDPDDIVSFIFCDDLGTIEVAITLGEGEAAMPSFEIVGGDVPDGTTHFYLPGDLESLAHTLHDFVVLHVGRAEAGEVLPLNGNAVTVGVSRWSDAKPYRIEIAGHDTDPAARFVEIVAEPKAANEPQPHPTVQ